MDSVRIVMADSHDVTGSIGRNGFLSSRMGAGAVGAPELDISFVPALRPDLFAQRVLATSRPTLDVPVGLERWFASMFEPISIPDDTVLIVLSMASAMGIEYLRHTQKGFIVSAPTEVTTGDREWLDENFEAAPLDVAAMKKAMEDLADLGDVETEIVVYNLSTYFPEEANHKAGGLDRSSLMANHFDLVVDKVAQDTGIYVLDVDRIIR